MNNDLFDLCLANGFTLKFTGSDRMKPLIVNAAEIMNIKNRENLGYISRFVLLEKDTIASKRGESFLQTFAQPLINEKSSMKGDQIFFGSLSIWNHRDVKDTIIEVESDYQNESEVIVTLALVIRFFYRKVLEENCIPFHGALVEFNGKGIIFAGKGGVGKSTCCRRLPRTFLVLSDDETLIVPISNGNYHGHPFPTWSDLLIRKMKKTWNVEYHVPVHCIFFLERADEDEIIELGKGVASVRIFNSACQASSIKFERNAEKKRALNAQLFENACTLAKSVPCYLLKVSLTGRFWEKIEALLAE